MGKRNFVLRDLFLISLSAAMIFAASSADALQISIIAPSFAEQIMESERDFYVIGTIDREGLSPSELPADIKVEVLESGAARAGEHTPIRVVQSHVDKKSGVTPQRDIFRRYEGKASWVNISQEELMKSPPPDLVYRNGDPASFYDPSLKAVVTENSFAVLIQGGCTKDYDSDYKKMYKEDLAWKSYRVVVRAVLGDEVLARKEFDVVMGSVPDKLLARFSPEAHYRKALSFAAENNIRVYKDLFPGYWNYGLSQTYEIPLRWRANDAHEYLSARVHAVIYNIPENRSASQTVELGCIAFEGWLDRTDEIYYYYYDIGEPSLRYRTWYGSEIKEGKIVRFGTDDRLQFTRAEFGAPQKYSPDNDICAVDWNVYNAVAADRGTSVTFCGVVTPIQPNMSDVTPNDDGTFAIGNRIAVLHYEFTDMMAGTLYSSDMPISLDRFYGADKEILSNSIYEFRHSFVFPEEMNGRVVTVSTIGYDKYGEAVDGTEEEFYLRVR